MSSLSINPVKTFNKTKLAIALSLMVGVGGFILYKSFAATPGVLACRDIPMIGFACPVSGLYRVQLASGQYIYTHGPDEADLAKGNTLVDLGGKITPCSQWQTTAACTPSISALPPLASPVVGGRVYNATSGQGIPGIKIDNCQGQQVVTGPRGIYTFLANPASAYCSRVVENPAGLHGPFTDNNPDIGVSESYEYQMAAKDCYDACDYPYSVWDRKADTGLDFRFHSELPELPPYCEADINSPHVFLIYGRGFTDKNNYAETADSIRDMASWGNQRVKVSAGAFGYDVDLRILCTDSGQIAVRHAVLSGHSFHWLVDSMQAQGLDRENQKYLTWIDASAGAAGMAGFCAGTEGIPEDTPEPNNCYNKGPSYAFNFGKKGEYGQVVHLHELLHTMGAVMASAPHAYYEHIDSLLEGSRTDIMIGNTIWEFPKSRTGRILNTTVDYNNDDYFHPAPPLGNYLYNHWNVGSPVNRFVFSRKK